MQTTSVNTRHTIYLLNKTKTLIKLLNELIEHVDSNKICLEFLGEIEKWDWEIESTLECFAQLNIDPVLQFTFSKKVKIRPQGFESNIFVALKSELISVWNNLISTVSSVYEVLPKIDLQNELIDTIDFDLYIKGD